MVMAKNKKKKDKKQKNGSGGVAELEVEVQRLRDENEALRARLEKIAELASDLPGEDEEEPADDLEEASAYRRPAGAPEPDVNPS